MVVLISFFSGRKLLVDFSVRIRDADFEEAIDMVDTSRGRPKRDIIKIRARKSKRASEDFLEISQTVAMKLEPRIHPPSEPQEINIHEPVGQSSLILATLKKEK